MSITRHNLPLLLPAVTRLTLFFLLLCSPAQAQEHFPNPPDSSLVDVTNWSDDPALNANGQDTKDDTVAIQAAIYYALKKTPNRYAGCRMVYIPDGTYYISDSLEWRTEEISGWSYGWLSNGAILGQSKTGTILKLRDNTPGYNDFKNPKHVFRTGTENGQPDGGGNAQAFHHYLRNFTLDCGNNPGAIAIDFLTSNRGSIKDVRLKGNGRVGISMLRAWPGPGMISRVEIDGFRIGIDLGGVETNDAGVTVNDRGEVVSDPKDWHYYGHGQYGFTFENITLKNQTLVGMQTGGNLIAVRKLTSINKVPTLWAWGGPRVVLLDSTIQRLPGANPKEAALWRQFGPMLLRNVRSIGSSLILENTPDASRNITGGKTTTTVEEWVSDTPLSLYPESSSARTLRLPIEETPIPKFPTLPNGKDDFSQWANVTAQWRLRDGRVVKAVPFDNQDDYEAIQAAIDSGKPIVYFPNGVYNVSKPVRVDGRVRLLIGYPGTVELMPGQEGKVSIQFEGAGTTILEHMNFRGVEHASQGTLVLKHCSGNYQTDSSNRGRTFIEDCVMAPRVYGAVQGRRHQFWARQLNAEIGSATDPDVFNQGADMWILNLKTEYPSRTLDSINGATEVFGAFIYAHAANPDDVPSLKIEGGRLSAACLFHPTYSYGDGKGGTIVEGFSNYVRETRNGETRNSGPYGNGPTLYVSGGTKTMQQPSKSSPKTSTKPGRKRR